MNQDNIEVKEYFVQKIEKYNKTSKALNISLILGTITTALSALRVLSFYLGMPVTTTNIILVTISKTIAVVVMICVIGIKMDIEVEIEEIKKIMASQELMLQNELTKGKGL